MTPAFWRGRSVLVTGHTGFKGAWLALWLNEAGAKVSGYALAPATEPSLYRDAKVAAALTHEHIGDIRDLAALQAFFARAQPEIVFHLAAQALVRRSYADPVETFSANVAGTAHVLEAVRACTSVRAAVIVTTDKCYRNLEQPRGYREDDALGGRDPYAASKAAAELVTTAYRATFFGEGRAAVATARAGNVIGGGDWSDERLMTDLVRAFAAGRKVKLRYPAAVRPWQHVLDALHGYLMLAEALVERGRALAQPWNFGPADEDVRPVAWIAEAAARLWGDGAGWEHDGGTHPHESRLLHLDAGKARKELGWRPAMDIEDALAWSIRWYREHAQQPAHAGRLCRDQIARFMAKAA
jgi:CDP-glucose 4,6-dehydratase